MGAQLTSDSASAIWSGFGSAHVGAAAGDGEDDALLDVFLLSGYQQRVEALFQEEANTVSSDSLPVLRVAMWTQPT